MAIYEWAKTFSSERAVGLNDFPEAQDVGEAIEKVIDDKGYFVPEELVERAKTKRHKLHKMFEWDDTVAGHKYRCEQAKLAMRSVKVVYQSPDEGKTLVTAFSSVPSGTGRKTVFVKTTDALSDAEQRDYVLQQAINQLVAWRKKWFELANAAEALAPLDLTIQQLRKEIVN